MVVVLPAGTAPAGNLTYLDDGSLATVTSTTPGTSPTSGGGTITVTGTGLGGATGLTVGGVPVTALVVALDSSSVTGTIPAAAAGGPAAVVVVFPAGTVPASTLTCAAPVIGGVSPNQGTVLGGTTVTISGTGLAVTTSVVIGDQEAEIVAAPTATQVVVTTPAHPAGTVPVAVTDTAGTGTAPGAFTYRASVTGPVVRIAWAAPRVGPTSGGQTVVVAGTGFVAGATTVFLCGTVLDPADVAVDAAGTALTFVAAACDPGETQLLVITSGGTAGTPVTYFASAALGAADGPGVGGAGAATAVRAVTGSSVLATTGLDVGHDGGWWALALIVSGMGLLMLRAGAVRAGVVRPRGPGPRVGRHVEVRAPRHR